MLHFLRTRWELLVTLCIFTVLKIPALHYPFFSDESWSYAPAIKLMYLHGPSLMPNAISVSASRGHPLLFYALAASWMKMFGSSHVAQHAFALFISLLSMIALYEVCIRLFSKRTAVISLLLLPLQVIFSVQSTFLLPEIMIALLALLTLYYYCKEKYLYTFLCCTALMFTKESGMVLGLVLGAHAALNLLNNKESLIRRIKNLLPLLLSGMLIGIFFLLQKKLNGWYLFPEHTGMISLDWAIFWKKFQYSTEVLFYLDYRFRLFQLVLMLAIIVSIHLKDMRYAAPLASAYLIYSVVEDRFSWLPRKVLMVIVLLSLLYTVYQLISLSDIKQQATKKFIYLSVYFIGAYFIFSCANFFTARYLVCALVFVLILASAFITMYTSMLYDLIYYLSIACILLTGYYGYKYDSGLRDINHGAFDAMEVQENIVRYFENEHLYHKSIFAAYPDVEHLKDPFNGFLHTDSVFSNVETTISPATQYLIFDNIDSSEQYHSFKNNSAYQLIYKTQKGQAWAEVYGKVK